MKKIVVICFAPLLTAALWAQGPPPRGGGFGGGGGFGRGGGGFGPQILGAGPRSRTPVTGEPYSGTETVASARTLSTGNAINRTHQTLIARDTQGRVSTTETVTPSASSAKAPYTVTTIFDPVAGFRYMLNSSTMIAIESPLPTPPSGTPPTHTRPANPNVVTVTLSGTSQNGVPATGTQTTETIPAGAIGNTQPIQVVRTTWIATGLQVPVSIVTSDPRFGTTDMELTNISTSDPTIGVPSGYTIQQRNGRGRGGPRGAPGFSR